MAACRWVQIGLTTWEALERAGKVLPSKKKDSLTMKVGETEPAEYPERTDASTPGRVEDEARPGFKKFERTEAMEIWALEWNDPSEADYRFVAPCAACDGIESFLAFPSQQAAERAVREQRDNHDCECHPVRLA
jgi:hypothetical protein